MGDAAQRLLLREPGLPDSCLNLQRSGDGDMTGKSLRYLKPASVEQRKQNAELTREAVASYKKATQDIHEICAAKGLVEPILTA